MDVDKFQSMHGVPGTYSKCYFDDSDPNWGAVLDVTKPSMAVFHAMFWPALALVLGSLTCGIFCNRCRAYEARRGQQDNSSSASTAAFLVEKSPPAKRENKAREKAKAKAKAKMKTKERGLEEEKKEILGSNAAAVAAPVPAEEDGGAPSPPLKKRANWL